MSEYAKGIRAKIGDDLLQAPTVTVLPFDDRDRVLLVRHAEGNIWGAAGGFIEPGESPAEAAVRELWEETGVFAELTGIVGVFGGPEFSTTYPNGDRVSWVSTTFSARPLHGDPKPDMAETLEVKYFARSEIPALGCRAPHIQMINAGFEYAEVSYFSLSHWSPPGL